MGARPGAHDTPSLGGGEDSWKPVSGWGPPGALRGPRGRVPWLKATFWREWGMWAGERGAEPLYRSVMAVLVLPLEDGGGQDDDEDDDDEDTVDDLGDGDTWRMTRGRRRRSRS